MYPNLLRELVAEFTLTDNPANTTTSQLRSMCHVDDSVILGSWLQETDHKAIEDQVLCLEILGLKILFSFHFKTFHFSNSPVQFFGYLSFAWFLQFRIIFYSGTGDTATLLCFYE